MVIRIRILCLSKIRVRPGDYALDVRVNTRGNIRRARKRTVLRRAFGGSRSRGRTFPSVLRYRLAPEEVKATFCSSMPILPEQGKKLNIPVTAFDRRMGERAYREANLLGGIRDPPEYGAVDGRLSDYAAPGDLIPARLKLRLHEKDNLPQRELADKLRKNQGC